MILGNVDNAIGDTPSQHFHEFGETIKAIVLLADVIHLDSRCTVHHPLEPIHIVIAILQYLLIPGFGKGKPEGVVVDDHHHLKLLCIKLDSRHIASPRNFSV